MSSDIDSLTEQAQKSLTISNSHESQQQPQPGGKKSKKKQKWKPLDLSSVPSRPEPQPSRANPPVRQGSNQRYDRSQDLGYRERGSNVALSKALVTLLRHKKPYDIPVDGAGYALVSTILQHPQFQNFHATEKGIYDIVSSDNKDRFETKGAIGDNFQIRATQGHSFKLNLEESGLELINDPYQFPTIVHGTYKQNWKYIKKEGLKRMGRTYVHFAIGFIGESHVTSGMRYSSEIVIVLDMEKAIADGLKFYASKNKVVLCEGDSQGVVSPKYFKTVKQYDEKTRGFVDINFVFEG